MTDLCPRKKKSLSRIIGWRSKNLLWVYSETDVKRNTQLVAPLGFQEFQINSLGNWPKKHIRGKLLLYVSLLELAIDLSWEEGKEAIASDLATQRDFNIRDTGECPKARVIFSKGKHELLVRLMPWTLPEDAKKLWICVRTRPAWAYTKIGNLWNERWAHRRPKTTRLITCMTITRTF